MFSLYIVSNTDSLCLTILRQRTAAKTARDFKNRIRALQLNTLIISLLYFHSNKCFHGYRKICFHKYPIGRRTNLFSSTVCKIPLKYINEMIVFNIPG